MATSSTELFHVLYARPRLSGIRLGSIVAIEPGPVVDFPGNPLGPQRARIAASLSADTIAAAWSGDLPALLVFENDDPSRPVIVDIVVDHPVAAGPPPPQARSQVAAVDPDPASSGPGVAMARIVGIEDGTVIVEELTLSGARYAAKTTIVLRNLKDAVVVVRCVDGSAIIIGQTHAGVPVESEGGAASDVILTGRRITIEAEADLTLIAGGCRLQLDARGKASTTADHIVSRARGTNKVQGGCVQLN